jgi:hypothetical protein
MISGKEEHLNDRSIEEKMPFTPLQIQQYVGPGQSRRIQSPVALEFWQPFIELWVTSLRNEHI